MESNPLDVEPFRTALGEALEEALGTVRSGADPVGILFSGGVDSALLAWELRLRPEVRLFTLGSEGSPDLVAGRRAADRLGLPWTPLPVNRARTDEAASRFEAELVAVPPVVRAVLLALALAIEAAPPRTLVCGQGADELFLGYAHYRSLAAADAERRSAEDLERLLTLDWLRTQRIAAKVGKTVVAPYLHPEFVRRARQVPIDLRLPRDAPKRFFREWAVARGLPVDLSSRPKKALQYGSGVSRLLRGRPRRES